MVFNDLSLDSKSDCKKTGSPVVEDYVFGGILVDVNPANVIQNAVAKNEFLL